MKLTLRNLAIAAAMFGTCSAYAAEGVTTDRGQFVYNLKQVLESDNHYTITFDATGDAASAVLLLTQTETNEVISITLGEVKKGENSFNVNLDEYAEEGLGKYTWSIELHNYAIPEDVVTEPVNIGGNRGGVVCMVDPTNEFYGYTVIGRTKNGGFDVYNQVGEKIMDAVHKNNAAQGGTGANNSCPMRGVQRGTTAQFANWGDKANGVVAFDLANPEAEPYGVFEGVNNGKGLIEFTGEEGTVSVGSGTPTVAYAGEGENTILFTFDEDIFGNALAANPIGTAMTTNKAAENWGFASQMAHTNVGLLGTKNGLFYSQNRANGMDPDVHGIGYIDIATKELVWTAAMEDNADFLASATGGIDINPAGDLFAISTYTSINVYHLSWDGNKPVMEPYKVIASPYQVSNQYTTLKFDAGNNLHVINQTNGYYQVILGQEEGVTVTPALAENVIEIVEVPAPTAERGQFAYNLKQTGEDNEYTITFDATGDAAYASLLLTKEGSDDAISVKLGKVKKGENSFNVDLAEYAAETAAKYNWSIELHNYAIPEDVVTKPVNIGGNRGGVVCMVDPTNEFYGYTVIGRTKNGGFDVYNQVGEKIMDAVHKNNAAQGGTGANNSCPMRGVQRGTTAQFANWGDKANGVVAFDLANPEAEPYGVFEGVNNGKGLIEFTGEEGTVSVGSGTPTVAYAGEGENTILFTFDEDIFGNALAANPIGTAMTTNKAAENWGFASQMAHTNVGLLGTKNGLFYSQNRANGMDPDVHGIGYIDIATKELVWTAAMEDNADFLASATGGIDINPAGDLFAISTYTSINVYHLSWDGNKPVMEPYKVIASPYQVSNQYTTLKFDAGNNLHVINQTNGYYQVILGQEEGVTVTPALAEDAIQITSGVESVNYDNEEVAPVYYNLMGVRVNSDALTPGVYVKVVGKKATKVVVK